jgi:hypothetical protein
MYLTKPIYDASDRRLGELLEFVAWFEAWNHENHAIEVEGQIASDMHERFITQQLFFDLRVAVYGFVGMTLFYLPKLGRSSHLGMIPKIFTQDPVEGMFSRLRGGDGAGSNTAPNALMVKHLQAAARNERTTMGTQAHGNVSASEHPFMQVR